MALNPETFIRQYLPEIKKAGGSLLTQMMLSLTNFAVGILLARAATKDEYALFVLGSTSLLVLSSLQNALINTPLTVFLPAKKGVEARAFLGGLQYGQWMGFLPFWLLMGFALSWQLWGGVFQLDASRLLLLAALWLAMPPFLFREFSRAVLYYRMKIRQIFLIDLFFVIPYLLGVVILVTYWQPLAYQVMLLLFAGYVFSAAAGYFFRRGDASRETANVRTAFSTTWPHTRWSLLSIVVYNIKTYGYVFIVTALAGLKDTADISAARLFIMPFLVIINSSQRYLLARGAQWLHDLGENRFRRLFRYLFFGLLTAWLAYSILLMFGFPLAIRHVLTGKYANILQLVWLWGGFALLRIVSFLLSQAMQILKRFKMLSVGNTLSGLIMLLLSFVLTYWFGARGALAAMLAGELVFALVVWPFYRRPVSGEVL